MPDTPPPVAPESLSRAALEQRIAELTRDRDALLATLRETEASTARLRAAYVRALEQLKLLRHRLHVAKAERTDPGDAQLAFDQMFAQVQTLQRELETQEAAQDEPGARETPAREGARPARTPRGRRDLAEAGLPEVRIEVLDDDLEGRAERIGFQESRYLGYQRGGPRCIVVARAVYKTTPTTDAMVAPGEPSVAAATPSPGEDHPRSDAAPARPVAGADAAPDFVVVPPPKQLLRRPLLAPSLIAHLLVSKYLLGVPFYRLEQKLALEGFGLDRGTMCRYAEDVGATLGALVEAARADAMAHAFCLATDATGVSIQPGPLQGRERGPCHKGHFFVVLADKDHVFFEYQPKHTSAAVCAMFRGYSGYLQADAHAIYDALFRGDVPRGSGLSPPTTPPPVEVGCWSHARRKFWEAAVCKEPLGVEGLRRIDALFAADALLAKLAPAQRKERRLSHVRPLVAAFFAWVETLRAAPRERGVLSTALGYVHHQRDALCRFLDDGRLRLENNAAERGLRPIATGRKAWLFFGSDDHAQAAANLFSLLAGCKLHGLDPEAYLAEVMHVMAWWPRDRYLELCPRDWARTRARLAPAELAHEIGPITVPPPLPAPEQGSPN